MNIWHDLQISSNYQRLVDTENRISYDHEEPKYFVSLVTCFFIDEDKVNKEYQYIEE